MSVVAKSGIGVGLGGKEWEEASVAGVMRGRKGIRGREVESIE